MRREADDVVAAALLELIKNDRAVEAGISAEDDGSSRESRLHRLSDVVDLLFEKIAAVVFRAFLIALDGDGRAVGIKPDHAGIFLAQEDLKQACIHLMQQRIRYLAFHTGKRRRGSKLDPSSCRDR